ncbi:hypothetical protein ACH5RR_030110 [Cinchona calisaya]|uniref:Elongator complex protein 2 n=1 Tax=Cinchona calisaya TaxID=153742 RepID=A0ABD2YV27_9GENT
MMSWKPEKTTGIWINVVTVGELSHCALGFYGGHWSPNGDSILADGYCGSFDLWKDVGVASDDWKPQKVPSGHFAAVSDIDRNSSYKLLIWQTTRVFAPWSKRSSSENEESWHEIALPQVHEESSLFDDLQADVQILGANMSALGLSQKPVYTQVSPDTTNRNNNDSLDTLETIPDAVPVELTEQPVEEQLAWHTLWPESHKLYGHGNELYSLCCDHRGKLVASSCKAQSASVAEIWLWQVGSWKSVCRLHSHRADESIYELVTRQEAHKRIIWACSWNPFGLEFATGSRDKTVKIWAVENGMTVKQLMTLPSFKSSVTALSWTDLSRRSNHGILAVGMESGLIE